MQRTTNYGLCQYEGSDKTSYLVNYNDDMLKIDTAIKGAADDATAAGTVADRAEGKADTNAGNIETLNTQINGSGGIATDVATLQGSVNSITSLIGNGEPTTTDKTIIGAINEINGKVVEDSTLASVTSDGVKTYGEIITELVTGLPALTANQKSRLVLRQTTSTSVIDFRFGREDIGVMEFNNFRTTASNMTAITFTTAGYVYIMTASSSGNAFSNAGSSATTSGDKFELILIA